jgi:2-aminoadipate transaminase
LGCNRASPGYISEVARDETTMFDDPALTQMVRRPGFSEFDWGQPDPDLLPVDGIRRAASAALDEFGPTALAYGAAEGPWPLLHWIRKRQRQAEGLEIDVSEIVGTAGNSDGLDQICTLFTTPGDTVLVESPTYHLALRIMRDHRLDLRPVAMDAHGLSVDRLEALLDDLSREGRKPRLLYTVPTFHNPSGVTLGLDRRRALVNLAAERDLLIVEDDVYRELAYDGPAPPSLYALAPRGTVLRLGSFAKSLAPGLRLGWLNGSAEHAHRVADSGLRDSGGSTNFYAGMVVSAFCRSGDFDRHVTRLKDAYRGRRDVLLSSLAEELPAGCSVSAPGGGYFLWVTLPAHVQGHELARHADDYRVSFIAGRTFCIDAAGDNALRLAFSLMKPDALVEGARRLGALLRDRVAGR